MQFTKEQQEAIESSLKQNTYIMAGPGSGKSTTLAEIARLILQQNSNNKVLLITFTNKSAKDIIDKAGNSDRISGGTFHSIAYRLMRQNGISFNICDTNKSNMIIRKIFDCKKDKSEFERIKNEISITKSNYPQRSCEYTEQYNNELEKYNMYDFDDIIFNGIEFIKEKQPEFTYTHILVDELQDTSLAQLEFLKQLYYNYESHMIGVADKSQAIYEFRGAKPRNVDKFIKLFKCNVVNLGLNFRSKNNIVKYSRNLIEHNITHSKIDLRAYDKTDGIVHVYQTNHPLSEIDYIVSLCRTNRNRDILILYRDRTNKMQLEYQLKKARLNYTVNDSTELVDRSAFRVYIAIMKIAAKDYDIYDLEIAAKGMKALGTTTVELIKQKTNNIVESISDSPQLNMFDVIVEDEPFYSQVSRLADANKKIKRGMIQAFKLQSEFCKLAEKNKSLDELLKIFPDYMIKSFDVPQAISDFLIDIAEDYEITTDSIKELCNNFGLDGKEEVQNEDAKIMLSTIHGAKGGESEMVIIPFANWKMKLDERVADVVESERRLFYVGITRAKERLYITYSGNKKPQFVKEMGL